MSTLDTKGITYMHDDLATVAKRLRADGHEELAADYEERSATELKACVELRSLGQIAREAAASGTEAIDLGARLARGLVADGWTPPAHFNGRITE